LYTPLVRRISEDRARSCGPPDAFRCSSISILTAPKTYYLSKQRMTVFTFAVFVRRTGEILRVRRLLLKPGVNFRSRNIHRLLLFHLAARGYLM
jgi:hypothetical protein